MRNHVKNGCWSQSFDYVNRVKESSRYYIDKATFLVYTLNIRVNEDNSDIIISNDFFDIPEKLVVDFGQFISLYKNIDIIKKIYRSYDISIDKGRVFDSSSNIELPENLPNIIKDKETLSDFLYRSFNLKIDSNKVITKLEIPDNLVLGINSIKNYSPNISSTDNYEGQASLSLAEIDEDCFDYYDFNKDKNNLLEKYSKSSSLLLNMKEDVETSLLNDWIKTIFNSDNLKSIIDSLGTESLDISFLFYPPILSSMQLEDKPVILEPRGIINKKIVSNVVFTVSRSFVKTSNKLFEIVVFDKDSDKILFKDSSETNPNSFLIQYKNLSYMCPSIDLELDYFEDNDKTEFPYNKFKVTYTFPKEIQKYLSKHFNYDIEVRISDLTSERT